MGDIFDEGKEVFRDYEIDGMWSSGEHEPVKADIRAWAGTIDAEVTALQQGQAGGKYTFPTWAALDALSEVGLSTGDGAEVWADAGTHTDPVVGGTVPNEGVYSFVSGDGWQWIAELGIVALAQEVDALSDTVAEFPAQLSGPRRASVAVVAEADPVIAGHVITDTDAASATTDMWGSGTYSWGIAKEVTEGGFLDAVVVGLQDLAGTGVTVRATVYKMPEGFTSFPGSVDLSAYDQLGVVDTPASGLLGGRRISSDTIGVRVPLTGDWVDPGDSVLVVLQLLNSSPAKVQVNISRAAWSGAEAAWLKGIYSTSTGTPVWGVVPGNFRVWGKLSVRTPAAISPRQTSITAEHGSHVGEAIRVRWHGSAAWRAADNFQEFAVAFRPQRDMRVKTFAPTVFDIGSVTSIFYRVYRRPRGLIITTPPGYDARDELLFSATSLVANIVDDSGTGNPQEMRLDISAIGLATPDWTYIVNWVGQDGSGATYPSGLALGDNAPANADDLALVWYGIGSAGRILLAALNSPAYTVYETLATPDFGSMPAVETVRSVDMPNPVLPGRSITIPGCELARPSGAVIIPPRTVTITDIAQETMTETKNVNTGAGGYVWVSRRYISNVVVTRVSDSVVLTLNTHYIFNAKTGTFQFTNAAYPSYPTAFDVSIAYKGYKRRYDLASVSPVTGAITITEGTARGIDPENYLPVLPPTGPGAGDIALYRMLVIPGAVEFIPVHRWRHYVRIGREAEFLAIREHNQRCLPKLKKAMRAGSAFNLLGYGDSITEIASGVVGVDQLVANTGRDGVAFLQDLPSDTITAIPKFNGPDGTNTVIRIGWNWFIKAAIEAQSACVVSYKNMGVGGTTTAATQVSGLYNGNHPTRMAAAIATVPLLVPIAFGMNELGTDITYPNLVAMIAAFRAAGAECVLCTVPATNEWGALGLLTQRDTWSYTNDQITRAAIDTNTAYVPLHLICGYGNEGGMGLSRESYSGSNTVNHPGPAELQAYGELAAALLV